MEYLREGNGGWTTENRSLYGQVHEITKETLPADSTYIPQIFLFSVKCTCIGLLGFLDWKSFSKFNLNYSNT